MERRKLSFSLQDRCTRLQITALHASKHFLAITNFSKEFLHSKAESDALRLQQPSESTVTSPTAVAITVWPFTNHSRDVIHPAPQCSVRCGLRLVPSRIQTRQGVKGRSSPRIRVEFVLSHN